MGLRRCFIANGDPISGFYTNTNFNTCSLLYFVFSLFYFYRDYWIGKTDIQECANRTKINLNSNRTGMISGIVNSPDFRFSLEREAVP